MHNIIFNFILNVKKGLASKKTIMMRGFCFICFPVLSVLFSCSSENHEETEEVPSAKEIRLSISFSQDNNRPSLRSVGNPNEISETAISSLMVFIFDPLTGKRDGFISVEEEGLQEVVNIPLTAGIRDIYVIANANHPGSLSNIVTYDDFKKIGNNNYTLLSLQGGTTGGETGGEGPIGGIDPNNDIQLTMVGKALNIPFNNTEVNHYWGYGENVAGHCLDPDPFMLERLVARVAVQNIDMDFQGKSLDLERTGNPILSGNYSALIDKVFMINTQQYISTFGFNTDFISNWESDSNLSHSRGVWEDSGDEIACLLVYGFLSQNLNNYSPYQLVGTESLTAILDLGRNYNIEEADSPVWFYAFENYLENEYPTMLVISLRFNYRSAVEIGKIKSTYAYYPIIINSPGNGYAGHDYIRPNYQYGIKAVIRGLGNYYDLSNTLEMSLRTSLIKNKDQADFIEIEENVGHNLFNWTGDKYRN